MPPTTQPDEPCQPGEDRSPSTQTADAAPLPGTVSRRQLLKGATAASAAAAFAPNALRSPVRHAIADTAKSGRPVRSAIGSTSAAAAADRPPAQQLQAVTVAPPGQSGFFSLAGQVDGTVSGKPGAFGPHVDDQRLLYWTFGYKPAGFTTPTGQPEQPTPGSRLYRDPYGVPVVYGDTADDVWFAAGWAFAQDRLFEMDAIRRMAQGTLAELTGPSSVPGDVQTRINGYTTAEYETMFAELLTDEDQVAVDACVAGINAWISRVLADPVQLLPAEYALLQALPEPWERVDVLASGVLIIRSVASAGGNEMANVANLVTLEGHYPVDEALGIFDDLFWLQDDKAVTTVPASSGRFPNTTLDADQRRTVLVELAPWATSLPAALANGPGTGAYPAPEDLGPLSGPATAIGGLLNDAGAVAGGLLALLHGNLPAATRAGVARAVTAIEAWRTSLHGGSYQFAVAPSRSATGHAMLVSGPQLGYSYPSELYELEVHGGGYNARGATVPGLPVVGIGMGTTLAWALTTGESKTIDSFIETVRPASGDRPAQYLFEGTWRDQDCRTEVVRYRLAPDGVPAGPALASVEIEVCRTHHGPIVAATEPSDDGPAGPGTALARSLAYAIWGQELKTLSGILTWNRATTFDEFAAGVASVTWNENCMVATADGTIAYWHPGLYPVRSPRTDLRLPTPGTGGYEWQGFLPFDQMPHAVDPTQGYLANWNTKPSVGWLEDAGVAPGQPAGAFQRVQDITAQIEALSPLRPDDLAAIDRFIGIADHRARALLPLLVGLEALPDLTAAERAAIELLAGWDGAAYQPPPGVPLGVSPDTTDGPAPTLFAAIVDALYQLLFGALPASVVAQDDQPNSLHVFDVNPLFNLTLRVLDPSTSALQPSQDYLAGRSPTEVLRAAVDGAIATLTAQYHSADPSAWRRPHPTSSVCSLTNGIIGPCLTMPFEDRGTYIHHVVFT
jgi:penicillin amidase